MANINTPAHDFAPPWLKIPSYNSSQRPSGADVSQGGHSSRREGHHFGFAHPVKENDYSFPRHSQYFNDSRHNRPTGSSKERKNCLSSYHHSLDFDDSQCEGSGTRSTNGDGGCNGIASGSQPSFSRRPHSRHDFRNLPSAYIKGESSNRPRNNGTSSYYTNKGKGRNLDSGSSNSSYNSNGGISVTSNNFNQEFPSLQGDVSEEPVTCPPSVWEKPRNIKIHTAGNAKKIQLIKKPVASENGEYSRKNSSLSSSSSSSSVLSSSGAASSTSNSHTVIITPVAKGAIYRALIPAKATTAKKTLLREGSKMIPPSRKPLTITPPPTAHTMEILVKHPKAPGNKSEFLKTLRNESIDHTQVAVENDQNKAGLTKEKVSEPNEEAEDVHQNGIDIAKLSIHDDDNGESVLSSSLEAERRLLREMGWKEEVSDDDNYAPLTEDEMREFRALSEQIAKNGFRRSLQTNIISPKRLAPFSSVVTLPTESDTSSSDSDSDF